MGALICARPFMQPWVKKTFQVSEEAVGIQRKLFLNNHDASNNEYTYKCFDICRLLTVQQLGQEGLKN